MATFEFKLPDIGEGVVEGEIVKWMVKEGDEIAEDQPLVEVMTDKATVVIPSPKKGRVLKTHGAEGDLAKVHHPLVTLELEAGAASAEAKSQAASHDHGAAVPATHAAPMAAAAAAPTSSGANGAAAADQKVLATPVTRRIAREHGINLASLSGTGPQGRVTKADVMAVISGAAPAATNQIVAPASARAQLPPPAPLASTAVDERIPLRGLRKKIAEKMVRSKFTAPHFTFVEEVDCTELVALRKRLNEKLAKAGDPTKLSFLPFIVKATIAALKKYPSVNANMDEATQELILRGEFNIGIAASTDDGLTVPVIRNADRLSIAELAREIARLGTAAREKKLKMEELTGGTFTISSLGQTGGLFATPIINHPEVAILGVHKMRKRPIVDDEGNIVVRDIMNLSGAFDHRVVDGALGADFTYAIIRYLENPEMLFLEMT